MPEHIPAWRKIPGVQWILSLAYTTILFLDSVVFGFVIVLFGWLPFPALYHFARAWAGTNLWLAKTLCGLDWTVEGRENIPREGAHVSMWKHTSTWETMAQMVVFPPQAWVLKREILWIPLVGWACWMLKCIAIDRGAGHRAVNQVLDQGRDRLAAGIWVLVFPEGTRMAPGETRKYGVSGSASRVAGGREDRAGRAQRRRLLAAARAPQEAGARARRHRPAGRGGRTRTRASSTRRFRPGSRGRCRRCGVPRVRRRGW